MRAVRTAALAIVACSVAWLGGRVFDAQQWVFYVAAVAPIVAGHLLALARRWVRAVGLALCVVGVTVLAIIVADGGAGDLAMTLTNGFGRLLSTEWPSPLRPEIVGIVALVIGGAAALAAWLAGSARLHLLPLLPLLIAGVALAALAAPAGTPTAGLAVGGAGALVFAASHNDRWRPTQGRGDRSTVAVLLAVMLVGAGAAGVIDLAPRADPRDEHPPVDASVAVDPLDAVEALQSIEPPIDLFTVTVDGELPSPSHWRMFAADEFDGERWTSSAAIRPIGRRLSGSASDDVEVGLRFETDTIDVMPLPGTPVTVDADVSTDPSRALVRLDDTPTVGQTVTATVLPFVTVVPDTAAVRSRPIDPEFADLISWVRGRAGTGTTVEQLRTIERMLHDDYALTPDNPGAGVQQVLIDRFLRDSPRRGTAEQFVAGFVMLARALGADARVAAGFVVPEGTSPDRLTSKMAAIWPEVYVDGSGWVVFSPVPDEETTAADVAPPVQRLTPVAPQPPAAPPAPEQATDQPDDVVTTPVEPESTWTAVIHWTLRIVGAVALVVAPFAIAAVAVLAAKRRRRRRLLGASTTSARACGVWAATNDVMVDAGLDIDRSWTDRQIASAGGGRFDGSGERLRQLGDLSSAATFAREADAIATLDDWSHERLVAEMERFERDVMSSMSRRRRLRYRLSLRSLRKRSSSPVSQAASR